MAHYRIWGRIEKRPEGSFRAVASALPEEPGAGPQTEDVRVEAAPSLAACRIALGRLVFTLSSALLRRGDQIVWVDVR
jgi:hypothetical protein